MSQFARPNADINVGLWGAVPSGTPLYDRINETTADDNDYIVSPQVPPSQSCEFGLSQLVRPTSGDGTLTVRMRATAGSPLVTIALYDGATQRASQNFTVTNSFVNYNMTIPESVIDLIDDLADLRLQITAT